MNDILGPQPKPIWTILATVALLMIVVATFVPIFTAFSTPYIAQSRWFAWLYAAGALLLLVARLFSQYKGSVERVRRLSRIECWSAIFFCVGAFFLFYDKTSARDWLAFTLAGGAIQIFTSIMIPLALRKAMRNSDK
ncbi:MAG: hypothetical protein J6R27_05175 [Muribaculaceae bacterium]|nr:hypothetical protein [Muribaculaceae bacterium]